MIARSLGGVPLGAMERYASRKGREHERVLETVKAKVLVEYKYINSLILM